MNKLSFVSVSMVTFCLFCLCNTRIQAAAPTWDGTVATEFAGGDGTQASPYQIATPSQLAYLAKLTNETKDYSNGKYFILTDDIYLNDSVVGADGQSLNEGTFQEWTPIGRNYNGYYFYGYFDGQGHTISGMYISAYSHYQGLFGYLSGKVSNLVIQDCYLNGYSYSGMIAGKNGSGSVIENCIAYGYLKSTNNYQGGISGESDGYIIACANYATITVGNYDNTGGITGYANGAGISNCVNYSTINGDAKIGGICGSSSNSTISHCFNQGDIKGGSSTAGIVGYDANNSTISDCSNSGNIACRYNGGGIVGYGIGTSIRDCSNHGALLSMESYGYETGGIAGYIKDAVIDRVINYGSISGTYDYGGIVGKAVSTDLRNAWNNGDISGYYNAGGIVGTATNTTLVNVLNSGSVQATYSYSSDSYKCGGLVGNLSGTLTNGLNVGDVISSLSYQYTIGYVEGTLQHNYAPQSNNHNLTRAIVNSNNGSNAYFGYYSQRFGSPVSIGSHQYTNVLDALNAWVAEDTTGKYCPWAVEYGINNAYPYPTFARVASPTIFVGGDGSFTISADSAATIYYTTDGSTPTTASSLYSGAGQLSGPCQLQAIATYPTRLSSAVASYNYGMALTATPVITLSGNTATITCSDNQATIYYCTDEFEPALSGKIYTGPLQFDYSTTLKACAVFTGKYKSENATTQYQLPQPIWDGTVDSEYASGSGTEDDPYIIMTARQLAWLAYNVNSFENYSKDVYYKLGDDIYLNGRIKYGDDYESVGPLGWTPVGYKYSDTHLLDFQGHFDGNGHTVHGLFYNNTSDKSHYIGLFGRAFQADIHDLAVDDVFIRGYQRCGGIVGHANGTEIFRCFNFGGYIYSHEYLGGIAGYIDDNTSVNNCTNYGDIYSIATGSYALSGGIAGELASNTLIKSCTNYGSVTGQKNCIGGIAGRTYGTIQESTNYGRIQMTGGNDYTGGITGYSNKGTLISCQNFGAVTGYRYSAGICGYVYTASLSQCNNHATINGSSYVGGIAGNTYSSSTVSYCQNTDSIFGTGERVGGIVGDNESNSTTRYCHNTGSVQGSNHVGGIDGYCSNSIVQHCFNAGSIIATNGTSGGIIGYIYHSNDNNNVFCDNFNSGAIRAKGQAGGVIGEINTYYSSRPCYVRNSYNTGIISSGTNAGGIAGISQCTSGKSYTYIQNCYNTGTVTDATNKGELIGTLEEYSYLDHCYFYYSDTAAIDLIDRAVGYNSNASATWLRCFNDANLLNEPNTIGDTTAVDLLGALNIWASQNNSTAWATDPAFNNGLPYLTSFICATPVITQENGKFVITTSTMSARIYYTLDRSIPTENSTLYTGPINTSDYSYITAIAIADGFLPSALAKLDCFTTLYTYGDVNNDGHIRTGDVVSIVNYILDKVPEVFIFRAADVNKDSIINISDAVNVVGMILGTYQVPDNAPSAAPAYRTAAKDIISGEGQNNTLSVSLTNQKSYSAFQLDLDLPEGVTLSRAALSSRGNTSHTLSFNMLNNGSYRLVCFSLGNQPIKDHAGVLMQLELSGAESLCEGTYTIPVHDICLSDACGQTACLENTVLPLSVGAAPTGSDALQQSGLLVAGGKRLTVISPEERDIHIFSLDGRHIATLTAPAGTPVHYELPQGVYFVGQTKVTILK